MEFSAVIDNLSSLLEWIKKQLGHQVDAKRLKKIELASEEVFVNIIHHGYKGQIGKIEVHVQCLPTSIEITFADNGPPFNPLETKKVDHSIPIEEMEVGGLGIHLIKQLIDEVRYQRTRNQNVLTLTILLK